MSSLGPSPKSITTSLDYEAQLAMQRMYEAQQNYYQLEPSLNGLSKVPDVYIIGRRYSGFTGKQIYAKV